MITVNEKIYFQNKASLFFKKANISTNANQIKSIEIADFNLNNFEIIGLSILVNDRMTDKYEKEIVILPNQTCPQHMHPIVNDDVGKEETLICRWGVLYLYVPGENKKIQAKIPKGREDTFTVFNEIILKPSDKFTILPETWHWFQAGNSGAVVTSLSNITSENKDVFKDINISRFTIIKN